MSAVVNGRRVSHPAAIGCLSMTTVCPTAMQQQSAATALTQTDLHDPDPGF
jgi:hypothetical protein